MERFTVLQGQLHVRVGKVWVPIVETLAMLDALIDDGTHRITQETSRGCLERVLVTWSKTGELPKGETA
jgi:hypothetical protein